MQLALRTGRANSEASNPAEEEGRNATRMHQNCNCAQCTSVHPVHSASVCIPCQGIYHLEHLPLSPPFASPDKMLSTALIARRTVRKLLGWQSLWLMHSVRIPYVRIAHQNSRMQYQISTLIISMILSIFYHWPIHW